MSSDGHSSSDTERNETKWSPAGFEAPDPELSDEIVVCAGCGESAPVSDMGVTGDNIIRNDDDEVLEVTRHYIHNDEECMLRLLETESDRDRSEETA